MRSAERPAGCLPGRKELPPVAVFVVPPDKHHLLARHCSRPKPRRRRRALGRGLRLREAAQSCVSSHQRFAHFHFEPRAAPPLRSPLVSEWQWSGLLRAKTEIHRTPRRQRPICGDPRYVAPRPCLQARNDSDTATHSFSSETAGLRRFTVNAVGVRKDYVPRVDLRLCADGKANSATSLRSRNV